MLDFLKEVKLLPEQEQQIKVDKSSLRFIKPLILTAAGAFLIDLGYTILTEKNSLTPEAILVELSLLTLSGIISHRGKINADQKLKEINESKNHNNNLGKIVAFNYDKAILNHYKGVRINDERISQLKTRYDEIYNSYYTSKRISIGIAINIVLTELIIKILPTIK